MTAGVLVVAKAPVAGAAKTRVAEVVGDEAAAELAAASLLDTIQAAEAFAVRAVDVRDPGPDSGHRTTSSSMRAPLAPLMLALSGEVRLAARSTEIERHLAGWEVVQQRGCCLGTRLHAAHADAGAAWGPDTIVVQVGMDTPQLTPGDLAELADGAGSARIALGPAADGGWWGLATPAGRFAHCLAGVQMSTVTTGRDTARALRSAGAEVTHVRQLRDIDRWADAIAVAAMIPASRTAAVVDAIGTSSDAARRTLGMTVDEVLDPMPSLSPAAAFAAALRGEPCEVVGSTGGRALPTWRWGAEPDEGDEQLLRRCSGATVDIGCGPGRLTRALTARGVATLGIDIVPEAVRLTRERGAAALHRDVFDRLPGEGRWATALLADGNIGIGGDPVRLLRRVADLIAPDGRVVVDVAMPGGAVRVHRVRLKVSGRPSRAFLWAEVPADQLQMVAAAAALRVLEIGCHADRWFGQLVRHDVDGDTITAAAASALTGTQ